jgi:hypothetical protein
LPLFTKGLIQSPIGFISDSSYPTNNNIHQKGYISNAFHPLPFGRGLLGYEVKRSEQMIKEIWDYIQWNIIPILILLTAIIWMIKIEKYNDSKKVAKCVEIWKN